MYILGIETSCDDTAAAVIKVEVATKETGNGRSSVKVSILSDLVQSQAALHSPHGGIVPELASRRHLENISPVVATALEQSGLKTKDISLVAATQGPGLVGSLLVGFNFAKAFAIAGGIPFVGVDHINGHLHSAYLDNYPVEFPAVALIVSGGHSSIFHLSAPDLYQVAGKTRDDAAGEAFDKVARLLGLGYPGGPIISQLAQQGDPMAFKFPRALLKADSLDFSFSGLKTALAQHVRKQPPENEQMIADICASFQEAVVEVLVEKTSRAVDFFKVKQLILGGGVAANPRLAQCIRQRFSASPETRVFIPPPRFCTDNAAMIAMAGFFQKHRAGFDPDSDVYSRLITGQGQKT